MEQQDLHKRLLLAIALSILVFVGYGYLFEKSSNTPIGNENNKTILQQATSSQVTQQAPLNSSTNTVTTQESPKQVAVAAIATIDSPKFKVTIDQFGRMGDFYLLENKYRGEDGKPLSFFDSKDVKPLEIRFTDTAINAEAFKTPYVADRSTLVVNDGISQALTLTQKLSSVTITKKITFKSDGEYNVAITTSKPLEYYITTGSRPIADKSRYMVVKGALSVKPDGKIDIYEDGKVKDNENFSNVFSVASFDRYYVSLFFSPKNDLSGSITKIDDDNPLLFLKLSGNVVLNGYIGSKDYTTLNAIDPKLTKVIEYGWFTWLSRPFFYVIKTIHDYIGNWGWAIVIFTILVKLILFWPTYKGMLSMQKLKDLAPKMKELKERYKDDPAKMNMKTMELYKKHKANPFGGCLPMLLQIPIFFALYRVLLNADELQGAPWILWIHDLAIKDPYYLLPLLMGAAMWYQQRITPSNFTDPMQEKIFKFFPVLMTAFFVTFPSGLVLYWLTNNILSIIQQKFVNRAYQAHKQQEIEAHHKGH